MLTIRGSKTENISKEQFDEICSKFSNVQIDLGTGDGRFVFKKAQEDKDTLFIGIDPIAKQMEIYSKKANKQKMQNVLFVVGSIEIIPPELTNCANKLFINMPWGSLLEKIVNPQIETIKNVSNLIKSGGFLEMIIGYDPAFEPNETKRLDLPEINLDLIQNTLCSKYFKFGGLELTNTTQLSKDELKNIETTWSKKLTFGQPRNWYQLTFVKA